jgi:hypothetical protein
MGKIFGARSTVWVYFRFMASDRMYEITQANGWKRFSIETISNTLLTQDELLELQSYWIESGHKIREQIDNDEILILYLRKIHPPYEGTKKILFRGKNISRWNSMKIGFAWTENIETARMFGRGLNAVNSGGILLRSIVPPNAIICGPNNHSEYLGEHQYTADPFGNIQIEEIESFPLSYG